MTKRPPTQYEFMRMLEGLTPWQRLTITLRAVWQITKSAVHHPTLANLRNLITTARGFISAYGGDILRVLIVGAAVVLWYVTIYRLTR